VLYVLSHRSLVPPLFVGAGPALVKARSEALRFDTRSEARRYLMGVSPDFALLFLPEPADEA